MPILWHKTREYLLKKKLFEKRYKPMNRFRKYCPTQRLTTQIDESEETEVKKDIEWAIKEIEGLKTETSENYPHNKMIEKEIVLGILNRLDEPEVNSQIDKLANFIMSEVEGEPSQSQGAVDTAIRIIKSYQNQEKNIEKWNGRMMKPKDITRLFSILKKNHHKKDKQKMTREEAIQIVQKLLKTNRLDGTGLSQVWDFLKQPPTLCDFLGWEEGQEYEWRGNIFRIQSDILQVWDKYDESWYDSVDELNDYLRLRQANIVMAAMKH